MTYTRSDRAYRSIRMHGFKRGLRSGSRPVNPLSAKRVVGFRVEPKLIHWAVVEGTQKDPILVVHDKIIAPATGGEAAVLGTFRERARHLFTTYKPDAVAIRSAEPIARGANREGPRRRSRIEGVLMEASHSCSLPATIGGLATISSRLETKRAKEYLDSGDFRGLDLKTIPEGGREAVLAAVAQLSKKAQDEGP